MLRPMKQPKFITPTEVARELRVSKPTVVRWCQNGTLPASRFGHQWRINRVDYDAFLAAAKSEPS